MNKRFFINVLITLILGIIIYYFMLPPINVTAPSFWSYVIILIVIYFILSCFSLLDRNILFLNNKHVNLKTTKSIYIVGIIIILI